MTSVRVQEAAAHRIDEIHHYTRERWEDAQADAYIAGLFEAFEGIATGETVSRPISAAFGVNGYVFRYERHYVYWKRLNGGDIGIVTVLHQRMHQVGRFHEDRAAP